jgi:MFS superfamily sulfate permease-like transporter
VAFYSVMTYFFFGTCKHLSLGTHGVVSLMIGTTIDKYSGILYAENNDINNNNNNETLNKQLNQSSSSSTLITNNFISNDVNEAKVMIATSLAFLTGCIHVIFYILNLIYIILHFDNYIIL